MKRTTLALLVLLAVTAVGAACNQAANAPAAIDLEDRAQRDSYAQGFDLGRRGSGLPLETEAFLQGVRDGLAGEGKLDDQKLQEALMDFNDMITDAHAGEAEENLAACLAYLAENAQRPGVQTTASGLQYEVLTEGDGPHPTATDVVTVNYRGTLIDGTEFDSSYSRGEPATFPLGRVISGWTEGLQLMAVGSKYKLFVPPDLGYGDAYRQGSPIPPNSALIFEIELLGIEGQ